jgi:hypothetical protein
MSALHRACFHRFYADWNQRVQGSFALIRPKNSARTWYRGGVKDMTDKQAQAEAIKRWGAAGAIRARPPSTGKTPGRGGALARYRCVVGNGHLGPSCSVQGQGDTWRAAFEDARPLE